MKKLFTSLLHLSFSVLSFSQTDPPTVHDPSTVIRNIDGKYYTFTTHWGVGTIIATDPDFINYEYGPSAFPDTSTYPSWINDYVDSFDAYYWAPDVVKMNGYYYLYFSCSNMGSARSAIGVARSTNLSGPWTDSGMVVYSSVTTDINAIDPGILKDNGKVWMVYGSYLDGIGIIELDSTTAKPKAGAQVTKLAGGNNQAIEGASIIKNGGYYYLFTANGYCCAGLNSTYYTMVARSTSITGPYTGWRTFLPNQDGTAVLGPGHIAYGEGRLTYHYYSKDHNGEPKLKVRADFGFHNGWPYVGTHPSALPVADGGVYRITPRHSGKAVDVASCGTANGTNVQQWSWLNNDCQKWRFTDLGGGAWRISPLNAPDMALDLTSCSLSNAANIQLWTWADNDCQKWKLVERDSGYYAIQNLLSGKVLDILNFDTANGASLIQYTNTQGSQNQEFSFEQVVDSTLANGTYTIKAKHSNKVMSIAGWSTSNGAVDEQWSNLCQANEKFIVQYTSSGYIIKPSYNTKVLSVNGYSTANGAAINQWDDLGQANQRYQIVSVGGGYYKIVARHSNKCLAVTGNGINNGDDIVQWEWLNADNFKWAFESPCSSRPGATTTTTNKNVELLPENNQEYLKVYPNPSTDHIIIQNSGIHNAQVQIYDMSGKLMMIRRGINNTETIDVRAFAKGVYTLKISGTNKIVFEKIIVR